MTPQSDEDEVWRQIVASFNEPAVDTAAGQPWPDSENLPAEPVRRASGRDADDPGADASGGTATRDPADADDRVPDGEADEPDEPDEGHYEPPPPPPLPRADASTRLAWAGLFGGPAYLLLAAVLGWHMPGWALFTAVAAFIGGFVALVVRMGDGPPGDSGWDDGAVI
ncbi:hypothetical protein [Spongiactinospora sp. TRM90649]|uniref:hypothetical protein n=1 Tax=Spongiactinospora sp. TRM90649 TaxID=3031114 RepID=UPI0023F74A0A|nr:hypothetical protein [Spongiactinospora sp. TRM90649]MDF5758465.1 hypothetical protein [Spongiactinospora sp. TRM90649]